MKNWKEKAMHLLFLLTACVSIAAVVLICVFLFASGVPAIQEIGLFRFLLGTEWRPGNNLYGILPMIVGSKSIKKFLGRKYDVSFIGHFQ